MKVILLTTHLMLGYVCGLAQNPWTAQSPFPPETRSSAVAFTINSKVYVCGGAGPNTGAYTRNDLWEFDTQQNTWTKKADFPGQPRMSAVGFALNNKGYFGIGTGTLNQPDAFRDFYSYDPIANTWTRMADYPNTNNITGQACFSINEKGYVAGGVFVLNGTINTTNAFYQFDPTLNIWTQKTNVPDGLNHATAFSVNGKGYVGLGSNLGTKPLKFYEYDPVADTWITKTNFPSQWRVGSIGISSPTKGYVESGTGDTYKKDFWEYSPNTNSWRQLSIDPGGYRADGVGAWINNVIYLGIGASKLDWWRYSTACDIGTSIVAGPSTLCTAYTYALQNYPIGATLSWTITPATLFTSPASGNTETTLLVRKAGTSGTATMTFTIAGPCSYQVSKVITVGTIDPSVTTSDDRTPQPNNYIYHTATALLIPGTVPSNYNWYEEINGSPGSLIANGLTLSRWPIPPCTNRRYQLQVSQQCGVATYHGAAFNSNGCGHLAFSITPNPTSQTLTVEKQTLAIDSIRANSLDSQEQPTFQVSLYNSFGEQVFSFNTDQPITKVDLNSFPAGLYILKITDKYGSQAERIKIEK